VKVDAGKKLQGLREAAQSEGECQQKLEGLREAERTELVRTDKNLCCEVAPENSIVLLLGYSFQTLEAKRPKYEEPG
jgi:hypothetical protein